MLIHDDVMANRIGYDMQLRTHSNNNTNLLDFLFIEETVFAKHTQIVSVVNILQIPSLEYSVRKVKFDLSRDMT